MDVPDCGNAVLWGVGKLLEDCKGLPCCRFIKSLLVELAIVVSAQRLTSVEGYNAPVLRMSSNPRAPAFSNSSEVGGFIFAFFIFVVTPGMTLSPERTIGFMGETTAPISRERPITSSDILPDWSRMGTSPRITCPGRVKARLTAPTTPESLSNDTLPSASRLIGRIMPLSTISGLRGGGGSTPSTIARPRSVSLLVFLPWFCHY